MTDVAGKYPRKMDETVVSRETGGKTVLLNLESGGYFTLNRVGTFVWASIDGATRAAAIVQRVVGRFEVQESEALQDVCDLLLDLERERLIELHEVAKDA